MKYWLPLLLIPSLVNAADFHVTKAGSGALCTLAAPCLTIEAGLAVADGGDTLYVHAGVYAENLSTDTMTIVGGSSWTTNLLVSAYPGDTVTVRPAAGERVLFLDDATSDYIEFRNLHFDGVNVTSDVVKITADAHHIRIRGGSVKNAGDGVLDGGDLEQGILVTGSADGCEFIGIEVALNGEVANLDHGLYVSTDGNLIENCHVYSNAAIGIKVLDGEVATEADNNIVRGNNVHGNGTAGPTGEGITVCGDSNLVEYNVVHGNQHDGIQIYDVNGECDAIDTLIRYNWVVGNGGGAIVDDATAVGTIQTGNLAVFPQTSARGGVSVRMASNNGTVDNALR